MPTAAARSIRGGSHLELRRSYTDRNATFPRGVEVARQLGRMGGRKRQMTATKVKVANKLLASGVPARYVASNRGVSIPTLYRWVPASTRP